MKIKLCIFYGFIWNYIATLCLTISQERFREFSESICGNNCRSIHCPLNTVMKIQMVELSFKRNPKEDCFFNEINRVPQPDEEEVDHCQRLLRLEWSQYIDSKCSNQSRCAVCQTQEMKINHKRCLPITDIIVKFLCISNSFNEETVPANSYVDLNCEYLLDHRIIIYKASLIAINTNGSDLKSFTSTAKNKACSQVDVSSLISKQCSFLTKCQAGPNPLVLSGCRNKQLLLQYACVPKSVIKIDDLESSYNLDPGKHTVPDLASRHFERRIPVSGIDIITQSSISKKAPSTEDKLIWIISGVLIVVVLIMILSVLIWLYSVGKCRTRQTSLFHKIKDAHFCPPPTPIDKIQIDLTPDDPLFPNHSKDYNTLLHDQVIHQLKCGQMNCDHSSNSISKNYVNIHSNLVINSSNSSNGAGSSGQISNFQSDSTKDNPSTIFNYLTSERNQPIQTYI